MVVVCVAGGGSRGCSYFYLCTSNHKESQGLPLGETAVKIERAVFILFCWFSEKLRRFLTTRAAQVTDERKAD